MNFFNRVRRFPTYIANGLIIHKLLTLLEKAGILVEPYYYYQEGPFLPGPPGGDIAAEGFDFIECGEAEYMEYASSYPQPPPPGEFRERLEKGQRCFALLHKGRTAAITWSDSSVLHFTPCLRPLADNEAYLFGAETRFEFRGRRVAPYLRYRCYEALAADGRTLLYSYSHYFNYPARHFKEKLGARVLFAGLHLRLFGRWGTNWTFGKRSEVVNPVQTSPWRG